MFGVRRLTGWKETLAGMALIAMPGCHWLRGDDPVCRDVCCDECKRLPPVQPCWDTSFFGYSPTCWYRFPIGWTPCPAPDWTQPAPAPQMMLPAPESIQPGDDTPSDGDWPEAATPDRESMSREAPSRAPTESPRVKRPKTYEHQLSSPAPTAAPSTEPAAEPTAAPSTTEPTAEPTAPTSEPNDAPPAAADPPTELDSGRAAPHTIRKRATSVSVHSPMRPVTPTILKPVRVTSNLSDNE